MRGGRDITERDLEKEVKSLIKTAVQQAMFEPADKFTICNARNTVSKGMSALKTRGVITGYRIDMRLDGTKIIGNITYTPLKVVRDVVIDVSAGASPSAFDRAMKGI